MSLIIIDVHPDTNSFTIDGKSYEKGKLTIIQHNSEQTVTIEEADRPKRTIIVRAHYTQFQNPKTSQAFTSYHELLVFLWDNLFTRQTQSIGGMAITQDEADARYVQLRFTAEAQHIGDETARTDASKRFVNETLARLLSRGNLVLKDNRITASESANANAEYLNLTNALTLFQNVNLVSGTLTADERNLTLTLNRDNGDIIEIIGTDVLPADVESTSVESGMLTSSGRDLTLTLTKDDGTVITIIGNDVLPEAGGSGGLTEAEVRTLIGTEISYSYDFNFNVSAGVSRYRDTTLSTFKYTNQDRWEYEEEGRPNLITDFSSIDASRFFNSWLTFNTNEGIPGEDRLVLHPKTGVSANEGDGFILFNITFNRCYVRLAFPTSSNPFAHDGFLEWHLEKGFYTLLFSRKEDGETSVELRHYIDKFVLLQSLEKRLDNKLLSKTSADILYGNSLKRADVPFAVQNRINNAEDYEDTNISAGNFSLAGEEFIGLITTSTSDFTANLVHDGQVNLFYIWNKTDIKITLAHSNLSGGSLLLKPGALWTIDTRKSPNWEAINLIAIQKNELSSDTESAIDGSIISAAKTNPTTIRFTRNDGQTSDITLPSGGGADLSGIPIAAENKGIVLSEFTDYTIKANENSFAKATTTTSIALVQPSGTPVTSAIISLEPNDAPFRIWNKGDIPIKLVNNEFPIKEVGSAFPNGSLDLYPGQIYSFTRVGTEWATANISPVNERDLSNYLKAKIRTIISPERQFQYWNEVRKSDFINGLQTTWPDLNADKFRIHKIGGTQRPTINLNSINDQRKEIDEYFETVVQGEAFSGLSQIFFELTNSSVKTLFVWNQFKDHKLIVSFLTEGGAEITNVKAVFGNYFIDPADEGRRNVNLIEPGDLVMFQLHRKDGDDSGDASLPEFAPATTAARFPFALTPKAIGYHNVEEANIKPGAVTRSKLGEDVKPRYAQLLCNSDGITAREWLAITGTWASKEPDESKKDDPSYKLMRVFLVGNHYNVDAMYNINVYQASSTSSVWTFYESIHSASVNYPYGYKPPANSSFALVLRIREFANITAQTSRIFSIYLEKLGEDNGVSLVDIEGIYWVTKAGSNTEISTVVRAPNTSILNKSLSTIKL